MFRDSQSQTKTHWKAKIKITRRPYNLICRCHLSWQSYQLLKMRKVTINFLKSIIFPHFWISMITNQNMTHLHLVQIYKTTWARKTLRKSKIVINIIYNMCIETNLITNPLWKLRQLKKINNFGNAIVEISIKALVV